MYTEPFCVVVETFINDAVKTFQKRLLLCCTFDTHVKPLQKCFSKTDQKEKP